MCLRQWCQFRINCCFEIYKHLFTTKSTTSLKCIMPNVSLFGFTSALLKAAKKSSHGAASYEYGPIIEIGTLSLFSIWIVPSARWYGALNSLITWWEHLKTKLINLPIPKHHSAVSPMRILVVKLLAKLFHENAHHTLVRIAHGQTNPNISKFIYSCNHTDSWLQCFSFNRPVTIDWSPMHFSEVCHTQPSFIYVDYVFVSPI